jgi:hypothetical protein
LAAGGDYTVEGGHAYCADIVGLGDCAPFHTNKLQIDGGRVNVINDPNNYWENYRVDWLDVASFSHLAADFGTDRLDVDYATQAAARTNPSRPYVDIPVNILELGDVISMIRHRGIGIITNANELISTNRTHRHIRNAGRTNLLYQFGIAPLVGDLVKVANFQEQVQNRIRELDRLSSPRGLRRTIALGGWSTQASYDRVMQSHQYYWTDQVRQTTVQIVRAHLRWFPDGSYGSLSTSDRQRLALRSVLGLTGDLATLWEIIPWSWLIDWGSNVGQFFGATRNIIPATLSGVHIMRETLSRFETSGGINSPIRVSLHSKSRNPSFIAPVAHFPFLTAGQMGILGSLAVTR